MIHTDTLTIAWIDHVAKANGNADRILVEKVVRALYLLERLQQNKLGFIFKGGTALMLLLPEPKRLSIDIDIIVPDKPAAIEAIFDKIIDQTDFLEYTEDLRPTPSGIEKAHYKFYYKPETNSRAEKEYILLDILYEKSHYHESVRQMPLKMAFLKASGEPLMVMLPSCDAILGDKLTAFAPNTTGVPYAKGKEIEIIKQLFDIGHLFDHVEDIAIIGEVFHKIATVELAYRNLTEHASATVLEDILQTALCIATRGRDGNGNFEEIQKGIKNIRNFIFAEPFHLEKAMLPAAKAAYLAALLKSKSPILERFPSSVDMTDWEIKQPFNTRLNRVKRTNPEAFFYWYKVANLLAEEAEVRQKQAKVAEAREKLQKATKR